jgi:predicted amidohydrolase YtcJ
MNDNDTGTSGLFADVIFSEGAILTMDASDSVAEAVAVRRDEIVGVGSEAEMQALAGPGTRFVGLGGRTLLPGFIDPHTHLSRFFGDEVLRSVDLRCPPLGQVTAPELLVERLRSAAGKVPKGDWILGARYDEKAFPDQYQPTRHDLDRASTDHPIIATHRSGHTAVANSVALELAGVGRDTPDPVGGTYGRDAGTGEPDGVLFSLPAVNSVMDLLPPETMDQRLEALAAAQQDCLIAGVTSTHDARVSREAIRMFQIALAEDRLPVRTNMMLDPDAAFDADGNSAFRTGFGNDRLKVGPIKLFIDGSVPGMTGWMSRPYHTPFHGDACHCGQATMPIEEFEATILRAHTQGFQVAVHAGGDRAIDACITAFRKAQEAESRPDARHRIEHCHYPRPDQLDSMAELGISPSFFVAHTYYWGERYLDFILGPERAGRISPLRSARERGIRFSLHSDSPHVPVDPLRDVFSAVNRVSHGGRVLGAEERITVREALRAVTIDAAWQGFDEARRGSVEAGKLADFTILDRNPMEVDPASLRGIHVEEVVIGGETAYRRDSGLRRAFVEPGQDDD